MPGLGVRFGALAVLILGLAAAPPMGRAAAGQPSFDCDRARSDVERLICGDDELSALDVQLAKTFANKLAKAPAYAVNELKAAQKSWRRDLINCGRSDGPRECTMAAYRRRLSEL